MLDAPLSKFTAHHHEFTTLAGLETFLRLERIDVDNNRLEPLRLMQSLKVVVLAGSQLSSVFELLDNPLADARALQALPQLVNPLLTAEKVVIRLFDLATETLVESGIATRIGNSHRFEVALGGVSQILLLLALFNTDEAASAGDSGTSRSAFVYLPLSRRIAVSGTKPGDPTHMLPVSPLKVSLLATQHLTIAGLLAGSAEPPLLMEVEIV